MDIKIIRHGKRYRLDAMESDDRMSWDIVKQLTGDRGEMMRKVRTHYMEMDPPLQKLDLIDVLLITNAVDEAFFVLSKVEQDFNQYSEFEENVPLARLARRPRLRKAPGRLRRQ